MIIRNRLLILAAALLAIVLLAGQGGVARAEGPKATQAVAMTLQCDKLTGSALAYAKQHDLCGFAKGGSDIGPLNTVGGNCGTSSLYMQDLSAGAAGFSMSATSTLGPIANAWYNTSWTNWSTSGSGAVSGSDWLLGTTWSRFRVDSTGAGYVTGVMSGGVTLAWGGQCTFNYPSDGITVH